MAVTPALKAPRSCGDGGIDIVDAPNGVAVAVMALGPLILLIFRAEAPGDGTEAVRKLLCPTNALRPTDGGAFIFPSIFCAGNRCPFAATGFGHKTVPACAAKFASVP